MEIKIEPRALKFKKSNLFSKIKNTLLSQTGLIFLVVALQAVIIFLMVNPINLYQQLDVIQVLNNVFSLTEVPTTEIPIIARVGDNKPLQDVETIRKQNDINTQVYKDAQNGDYVLGYSTNKMIIYRKADNSIIYNGDNPQRILELTQQAISNNVITKTKEAKLITADSTETPELSIVVNVDNLKSVNAKFYENVQQNDIVATFGRSSLLVIYRPSTNVVVNAGKFATNINRVL